MKVHFFDKDGNFLRSGKMEESRIRHRLSVAVPSGLGKSEVLSEAMEKLESPFPSMGDVKVFASTPIYPVSAPIGSLRPLFYLYLEVPR